MLTIYDPDVSHRLSVLHCHRLGRPQSTRTLRSSPWDLVPSRKPEGKLQPRNSRTQNFDLGSFGSPLTSVKSTHKDSRGIRTAYEKPVSPFAMSPTQVTSWHGGLKVTKVKNRESAPDKRRIGLKAVVAAPNKSSTQIKSTVFSALLDSHSEQKQISNRTRRLARRNMSTLNMVYDGGKDLRPKGEDISLAAKRINCFERKTTIKRYFKSKGPLITPYGTEHNMVYSPPGGRYIHYDTRELLV